MIKEESNCQQCGLPCMKENCQNYSVTVLICDKCKSEVEELYYGSNSGKELCAECALEELERVKVE